MNNLALTQTQIEEFNSQGYLILRNYFDVDTEIEPIHRALFKIISLIIERDGLNIEVGPYQAENFDCAYLKLLAKGRHYGGEVYDLAKQIPAFLRLICSERLQELFSSLRHDVLPGIGKASYGIRIDNPNEEQFRSQWHQEFLFQPQSKDGVVFWTPLVAVTEEMGPVMLCPQSHKAGLLPVESDGSYQGKSGAYKLGLRNEQEVIEQYEILQPTTEPGDLILMDFLTLHQSGFNTSNRARWSIQSRFFNFNEPTGKKIGWLPSVVDGTNLNEVFGELIKGEL